MSLPLSTNTISNATGQMAAFFSQMSSGRNEYISIVKEPLQIINTINNNILFGYGNDNQNQTDISYIPRTGIFPAVLIYGKNASLDKFVQLHFQIDLNSLIAKVEENCKNYMMDGKTERVYVENTPYIPQNTPIIQNFFGLKYYYFKLNEVQ